MKSKLISLINGRSGRGDLGRKTKREHEEEYNIGTLLRR